LRQVDYAQVGGQVGGVFVEKLAAMAMSRAEKEQVDAAKVEFVGET
jgi:spore coat polysaccharide biosynthesis protein SpsF (cytidylyltransferase family)